MKGFYAIVIALFSIVQLQAQNFVSIERQSHLIDYKNNNGVAVADYDGDNDLDIFLVARQDINGNGIGKSSLFRNNSDGTFTNVAKEVGIVSEFNYLNSPFPIDKALNDVGLKMGASWADFDNDGFPDLLLTSVFHLQLFKNNGGKSFTDITLQSGFDVTSSCRYVGGTWFDYDNDGFLDVFLVKWQGCDSNQLFHNNGDGTFTETTSNSGLSDSIISKFGGEPSWMALPFDVNSDGLMDLYVSNDFRNPNRLFVNQGAGKFKEQAVQYGIADGDTYGMGITIGDYNSDGKFDLYITDIGPSSLYENNGNGTFSYQSVAWGVQNSGWAWGTRFADFDNDMDEDLMVVNGYNYKQQNFYYQNQFAQGQKKFIDKTELQGLGGLTDSNGLAVFDYDSDGDLDILIPNSDDALLFYENHIIDASTPSVSKWLSVNLVGTRSNRDAIGTRVEVVTDLGTVYRYKQGTEFLSQQLQPLHFGLGSSSSITTINVSWPSGLKETFNNISINSFISIEEGGSVTVRALSFTKKPGCTDILACNYDSTAVVNNGSCSYLPSYPIVGPASVGNLSMGTYKCTTGTDVNFQWTVTGGTIQDGQGTGEIDVKWNLDASGSVAVESYKECHSQKVTLPVTLHPTDLPKGISIARLWNEALIQGIRRDLARPPIHARNLFHTSIAMYDSWAVYHPTIASPYLLGKKIGDYSNTFNNFKTTIDPEKAQQLTISYAAYRVLSHCFKNSPHKSETLPLLDGIMAGLAYDISNTSIDYSSGDPAALGNFIAQSVIDLGLSDHSREATNYDNAFYKPVNSPMTPALSGDPTIKNPNRWQQLSILRYIDQAGNPVNDATPLFISPEWGAVVPFALQEDQKQSFTRDGNVYQVYHDPGAPPYLDTTQVNLGSSQYQWNFSFVSKWSSHLDPTDGVNWDISPASIGNNALADLPTDRAGYENFYKTLDGGDIGKGHSINPVTGQPYAPQVVPRGDYTRVLAEFWADGPTSETPPGHWFTLLNYVSNHPLFKKRFEGKGDILDDLQWDVKGYFLLGGAMHDAAITAWGIKGWYDNVRPVSAIRYMAKRGQSSDPAKAHYDVGGIPLEKGYIELVEVGDPLAGGSNENVGKIKLFAWRGPNYINNPQTDQAGVDWILAENWWPYQRPSFVTPPFAGYISGHSTYSRAAAELLTKLTGSTYFPGGMGEFVAKKNQFLVFEEGPSQDVTLQWATYQDAADQCSLSRIWGGIHPPSDDIPGRLIGERVGNEAFDFGVQFFTGVVTGLETANKSIIIYPNPVTKNHELTIRNSNPSADIKLYDLNGRSIKITLNEFSTTTDECVVTIPDINPGLYILRVDNISKKIVVR